MLNDLTLKKLKKTDFESLYNKFILGQTLNIKEYECLLSLAICFANAENINIQKLGYRIIVEYGNQAKNFIPLYEFAINQGLFPICKYIENHHISEKQKNFFTEWNSAFLEQYANGPIYQSKQQRELFTFFDDNLTDTVSVIAPTSYGKSELIVEAVKKYQEKKICILTSTKALLTQTKKRIQSAFQGVFQKIIVHPEMYNNDKKIVAVLTQERFLRLLKKDPLLSFDCIVIDEAHELLENSDRSRTLASTLIWKWVEDSEFYI